MKKILLTCIALVTVAVFAVFANKYYKYTAPCKCGRSVVVTLDDDGGHSDGVMSRSAKCSCGKYVRVVYHWKPGQSAPTIDQIEVH